MQVLKGHEGLVKAIAFAPDGSLFSGGNDGLVVEWLPSGEHKRLKSGNSAISSLALSLSGNGLAIGVKDGSIEIWIRRDDVRVVAKQRPACFREVSGLAFIRDESTLVFALGSESGSARESPGVFAWDWGDTTRHNAPSLGSNVVVRTFASLPEKRFIAWATDERYIAFRNLLQSDRTIFNPAAPCRTLAFSPDGKFLAAASDRKTIIYDLERKQEKQVITGHKGIVSALSYSPDGRYLLTGSWDKAVKFWDASSGREVVTFEWPAGRVQSAAFAADGMRAAIGGDEGTIVIWDVDF